MAVTSIASGIAVSDRPNTSRYATLSGTVIAVNTSAAMAVLRTENAMIRRTVSWTLASTAKLQTSASADPSGESERAIHRAAERGRVSRAARTPCPAARSG